MRMSKRYAKDEEALEVYSDKSKIFQLVTRFLSDSFFFVWIDVCHHLSSVAKFF
jgi:hypothetical protein